MLKFKQFFSSSAPAAVARPHANNACFSVLGKELWELCNNYIIQCSQKTDSNIPDEEYSSTDNIKRYIVNELRVLINAPADHSQEYAEQLDIILSKKPANKRKEKAKKVTRSTNPDGSLTEIIQDITIEVPFVSEFARILEDFIAKKCEEKNITLPRLIERTKETLQFAHAQGQAEGQAAERAWLMRQLMPYFQSLPTNLALEPSPQNFLAILAAGAQAAEPAYQIPEGPWTKQDAQKALKTVVGKTRCDLIMVLVDICELDPDQKDIQTIIAKQLIFNLMVMRQTEPTLIFDETRKILSVALGKDVQVNVWDQFPAFKDSLPKLRFESDITDAMEYLTSELNLLIRLLEKGEYLFVDGTGCKYFKSQAKMSEAVVTVKSYNENFSTKLTRWKQAGLAARAASADVRSFVPETPRM